MHNLGRTFFSPDTDSEDDSESLAHEFEDEPYEEVDGPSGLAYAGAFAGEDDHDSETNESLARPFSEDEELELASELLEVQDDQELDEFLGELLDRVARRRKDRRAKAKRILRRVKNGLKGAASIIKKVLPIAGTAVGAAFGAPGVGRAAASTTSNVMGALGLELEGVDPEERELEVARRYVRLSGTAAKAALGAASHLSDTQAAKTALETAARLHVPGLLPTTDVKPMSGRFELHGTVPGQRVLIIRGI